MEQHRIRILIVDDHPMVRKGLEATIEPEPDMEVVGMAATGEQALELFRKTTPDVTIMDLKLTPKMNGIQAARSIRREFPQARIVVLSAYKGDEDIYQALHAGAITYLLKETLGDDLAPIIREVHAGGGPIPPHVARKLADRLTQPMLTPRELDVLRLMTKGLRNKEIGAELGISEQTTQGHIKSIFSKLNVHDRTEAVTVAIRRGIIHID
jgi:two-component system NarL family response regulator